MYKQVLIVVTLLLALTPIHARAIGDAGFVNGVWLSDNSATEGQTITIYTAVYNQTDEVLKGTVTFLDNASVIGTVTFNVGSGEFNPVAMHYTLTAGKHNISAKIESDSNTAFAHETLSVKSVIAQSDNDQDGIADADDPDDDNDGISDEQELADGTNPRVAEEAQSKSVSISNVTDITLSTSTVATAKNALASTKDKSTEVGMNLYEKIDPYAQEVAQKLRDKSAELRATSTIATSESVDAWTADEATTTQAENTILGIKKESWYQLAAVGLSTLALGFEHWLWHIVVVSALLILRSIYRRRVF